MADITVVHAPEQSRYELRDGDVVPGFAEYLLPDDGHVDFTHTEVSGDYAGQGLAGKLIEFALADVQAQGKRIIPHCPFVQGWLRKHPGLYDDITDWPDA
jgi:predicted GNAT family acetyltransferase